MAESLPTRIGSFLPSSPSRAQGLGFIRGFRGFRGLGVLGFRGLGFWGLGFEGLGLYRMLVPLSSADIQPVDPVTL